VGVVYDPPYDLVSVVPVSIMKSTYHWLEAAMPLIPGSLVICGQGGGDNHHCSSSSGRYHMQGAPICRHHAWPGVGVHASP
jgi:hypothetical protein